MNLFEICRKTGFGLIEAKRFMNSLPTRFRNSPFMWVEEFAERSFFGLLVIIYGVMRIGKTFTGLSLAHEISTLLGCKFYSNTPCEGAETYYPADLIELDPSRSVIVLDEAHVFYNPRRSMEQPVINLIEWITQFGKRDNIMFCISQRRKGIDRWLREIVHVEIEMVVKGVGLGTSYCADFPENFVLIVNKAPPKYDSKAVLKKSR